MKQVQILVLALMAALLLGCSPEYNWREVSVGDSVGKVMFPDKPRTQTRAMEFSGHEVIFHLTSAEIGSTIFAVGYAPWPATTASEPDLRENLTQAVIASLYRNLGHEAPAEASAFGQLIEVRGGKDNRMVLLAKVWADETGLLEGLVMGPADDLEPDSARQFLESVGKGR